MLEPDFLVHNDKDTVGVVVVENAGGGKSLSGLFMETNGRTTLVAGSDIPLGHKIALVDIAEGDTIIKYGHDIGRATAPIARGEHAHTHNIRTKRW